MQNKQTTIAEILHLAADEHLLFCSRNEATYLSSVRTPLEIGKGKLVVPGYKEKFSCNAINQAIFSVKGNLSSDESCKLRRDIMKGLANMSCDTGSSALFEKYGDQGSDFTSINQDVQGMRYMWLKWAALMAEEQGV